jgi:hypothetical protein
METYEQIRDRYLALTRAWHPTRQAMPVHRVAQHDGSCHLEISPGGVYALVGTDRGVETVRDETRDLDELLYWIARGEASGRASQFELENRHPTNDQRRIWFAKAEEELGNVSDDWAERRRAEHAAILQKYPFRDGPIVTYSAPPA